MRQYSIAAPLGGFRGAGLGNQAIPMGKAWLAARALNCRYVELPWALNSRGYRKELGSSRFDWLHYSAIRTLARPITVTDEDYVASGILDYGVFIETLMAGRSPRKSVMHSSGMSGGYASIVGAREFLQKRFINTECGIASRSRILLQRIRTEKITIGVHLRAGDFGERAPLPGTFNNRIPISWYSEVVAELMDALSEDVHFFFVTEPDAISTVEGLITKLKIKNATICSGAATEDLGVLASADLVVCSVSSFSLLAAFLGDNDFLWYSDHLTVQDEAAFIWADDQSRRFSDRRRRDIRYRLGTAGMRGIPFPSSDAIFSDLLLRLKSNLAARHAESNLLFYGSIGAGHAGERET